MQIEKSTRLARHSTSGLPSVGQQQCGNSTGQPPRLGMFHGRSSSSRAFDLTMATEEQSSEQARPSGTAPRGLEPTSSYHRGSIIKLLSEFATSSELPHAISSPSTPGSINTGIAAPAIPTIFEPLPGPNQPDAFLPSRRPSLVRIPSANSNSNSAALCSPSGLPRIPSLGCGTYTTAAAAASSSSSPHPPLSSSAQQSPYPSPLFPAPPASPRQPSQSTSLGAWRGHLPSPIISSSGGTFAAVGVGVGVGVSVGGSSAIASPFTGSMTRNGGSFRSRILNFRDAASPSSSITSGFSAAERRQSNLEVSENAGISQLRSPVTPNPHQMQQQQQYQQSNTYLRPSFDDEDACRFMSADVNPRTSSSHVVSSPSAPGSSPFERPSGNANATPFEAAAAAAGAPTPPSTIPRGRSFRRPTFPRSVSLEPPRLDHSNAAAADDWVDGIGGGGGTAATVSGLSSINSRSSSQAFLSVVVGPTGGDRTAARRAQSDWGLGAPEDGDGDGDGDGRGGAASTDSSHLGGTVPVIQSTMDPSYRNAGRRGYKSSSGMGLCGNSLLDSMEDAARAWNKPTFMVPGCMSRLRLFQSIDSLDVREEDEEDVEDQGGVNVKNASEGHNDTDSGATGMEITSLDQILDPMLDLLDPGRKVARRCMQRLQNGASGISRPRAVESWADGEAGLRLDIGSRHGGGGGASTVSSDGSQAHGPALATLATQALKLPCVGLEKLNDPEKRQKVVQRLREAADVGAVKLCQILTNHRVTKNFRWQP